MNKVIINMNGNTSESLQDELRKAADAVRAAEEAVRMLTVHGRNYQVNDDPTSDLKEDQEWKSDMLKKLESVEEDISGAYRNLLMQKRK